MDYRIRQKGKGNFIVEKKIDNRWFSKTLLPEHIWNLLVCPDTNNAKVSSVTEEKSKIDAENFVQDLLRVPQIYAEKRHLMEKENKNNIQEMKGGLGNGKNKSNNSRNNTNPV